MKNKKFNSSQEMEKLFGKVLQRNFNGASIGEVKRAIRTALGPVPEINWPMDRSWAVVRARYIDENEEDITNPLTFGAPPSVETSQGRANLVNHPVFYGTFDDRTAMQEINVPLDSECFVSIWEFTNQPPTVTTFLSSVDERNDLSQIEALVPKELPKGLKGGYTKKSLAKALELRAGAFTSENYEFTSKIAHEIIYNNSANSVGLIYPSVVDPYRCNIALNPDFVAANMRCVRIYKKIWSGAFIFRNLARGTNENGVIVWKETGSYELDEIDQKYIGSNGPHNIHHSALRILDEKREQTKQQDNEHFN